MLAFIRLVRLHRNKSHRFKDTQVHLTFHQFTSMQPFSPHVFSFLNNDKRKTWLVFHFSCVLAPVAAKNAFVLFARGLCSIFLTNGVEPPSLSRRRPAHFGCNTKVEEWSTHQSEEGLRAEWPAAQTAWQHLHNSHQPRRQSKYDAGGKVTTNTMVSNTTVVEKSCWTPHESGFTKIRKAFSFTQTLQVELHYGRMCCINLCFNAFFPHNLQSLRSCCFLPLNDVLDC